MIPGKVVASMLIAGVEAFDFLKREILEKFTDRLSCYGFPTSKKKAGASLVPIPRAQVEPISLEPLRLDPFKEFVRYFRIQVDIPEEVVGGVRSNGVLEELVIQEFAVEINRRIYGLLNSITKRELEVLRKRKVELKSITNAASEMGVKPQAIVAFTNSIKKRVQKHLYE